MARNARRENDNLTMSIVASSRELRYNSNSKYSNRSAVIAQRAFITHQSFTTSDEERTSKELFNMLTGRKIYAVIPRCKNLPSDKSRNRRSTRPA
jgi:hypothetical protein